MLHETPLKAHHLEFVERASQRQQSRANSSDRPGAAIGQKVKTEVRYIPYGSANDAGTPVLGAELVESFGEVELEYAAIRRGAGVFDASHRGTLMVTGEAKERRDFLNRMITQELKDLQPFTTKSSFWLNRKGRIEADLFLLELGDRMLISVDILQAARAARTLSEFIVMEDVQVVDSSSEFHHVQIHGPESWALIERAAGERDRKSGLEPGQCIATKISGVETFIARRDECGDTGYDILIPIEHAASVWNALLSFEAPFVRPIGWHAYNVARIETGTPLFNIDFGTTNLPHETGILPQRVSFTKGCYLGQEVVARMENLGKPKQSLIGLRMEEDLLPTSGEQVFSLDEQGNMKDEIGMVTSSALSPMLGSAPIAFAMIRSTHATHGQKLLVNAEGQQAKATVGPLNFWSRSMETAT